MAQLMPKGKHGAGRVLVQNAGDGRAMIIRGFIPELTAYLVMQGKRYERTMNTTQLAVKKHKNDYLKGIHQYCNWAIEFTQRLMRELQDKFARHEWWVAWAEVCEQFQIPDWIKASCNFDLEDTFTDGGGI